MVHVDHVLSVMVGIADQFVFVGIDDEVEQLQRNLADHDGTIVGDLGNTDLAIALWMVNLTGSKMPKDIGPAIVFRWIVLIVTRPNRSISCIGIDTYLPARRLAHR